MQLQVCCFHSHTSMFLWKSTFNPDITSNKIRIAFMAAALDQLFFSQEMCSVNKLKVEKVDHPPYN